jgi:hypothetical protein
MHASTVLILALAGVLGTLSASASDTPIDIKSDLDGPYFMVEKGGAADKPILVVKRAGPGYNHFVKREFDCATHTVRYLGEGATLEEMNAAEPDDKASPIKEGSIPDQLSRLVCPSR